MDSLKMVIDMEKEKWMCTINMNIKDSFNKALCMA